MLEAITSTHVATTQQGGCILLDVTEPERWLILRALRRLATDGNIKIALEAQQLLDRLIDDYD